MCPIERIVIEKVSTTRKTNKLVTEEKSIICKATLSLPMLQTATM